MEGTTADIMAVIMAGITEEVIQWLFITRITTTITTITEIHQIP
jgi:hypothetical protein